MALPVLTPNSPSAGYISWTAFSIKYLDVSRDIPAGNTNMTYAYWLWNGGNPASSLVYANSLPDPKGPSALQPQDLLLFVNRGGVPINVQNTNVIEGSIIATDSIIGTSLQANTVDANKMLADTITSREIQAGAVTASELSTSSLGAWAVVNGDMEDVDPVTKVPAGWTAGFERTGTPTYAQETVAPLAGRTSVSITLGANSVEAMAARSTAVKPGDQIFFATAFRMSVVGVPVTLRAYFSDTIDFTRTQVISTVPATPSNVIIYDVTTTGPVPRSDIATPLAGTGIASVLEGWPVPVTTSLYVTGQITVPDKARYVRFVLCSGLTTNSPAHTAVWDALDYAPLITNVRIGDGAVTARTVQANAITANAISVGDFTNMIPNAALNAGLTGWTIPTGNVATASVVTAASGAFGLKVGKQSALLPRTNLMTSPDGGVDGGNWGARWFGASPAAGTYTGSTSGGPVTGTGYRRKTWTTAPTGNADTGFDLMLTPKIACVAGDTVTVSGYLRASKAGPTLAAGIYWYNSTGGLISRAAGSNTTAVANTWHRVSYTATAPAGAVSFYPVLDVTGGTTWAVGNTLDGSAALIEKSSTLDTFFDGSTAESTPWTYAWSGATDASTSVASPGTTEADVFAEWVDVTPGDQINLTYTTEGSWSSGNAAILAQTKSASGVITDFSTIIGYSGSGIPAGYTALNVTGPKIHKFAVPAGAVQMRFRPYISTRASVTSYAIFSAMLARRMLTGSLIVDGAIDGKTINGTTITGSSIIGTTIKTGSSGDYWQMASQYDYGMTVNALYGYTSLGWSPSIDPNTHLPVDWGGAGFIKVYGERGSDSVGGDTGSILIQAPQMTIANNASPGISLISESRDKASPGAILYNTGSPGSFHAFDARIDAQFGMTSGSGHITIGQSSSTSVQQFKVQAMATALNSSTPAGYDNFEIRRYLYDGGASRGTATVLFKNGAEHSRYQFSPDEGLQVKHPVSGSAFHGVVTNPSSVSKGIHWQSYPAVTTNASGVGTITHNAGFTPSTIVPVHRSSAAGTPVLIIRPITGTYGATTFQFIARDTNGAAYVGSVGIDAFVGG